MKLKYTNVFDAAGVSQHAMVSIFLCVVLPDANNTFGCTH